MDRIFVPAAHARATQIDGEAVVLNLETDVYYSLNATGSEAWRIFEAGQPANAAVAAICAEFDVTEDRAAADLEALIDRLVKAGLLHEKAPA